MNDYLIHVKSTLDKVMNDLVTSLGATYPGLKGVDIDNMVESDEAFKAENPTLLWQFLALRPVPRDPLYNLEFLVGAKTTSDAANYTLTSLTNDLRQSFEVEQRIEVGDYSGETAVLDTGYFLIIENTFTPQQYEHMSGIRFFSIRARGARSV